MLQRIASTALTTFGVLVAAAPLTDSPASLIGVVVTVLGGIWFMTRGVISSQAARIARLEEIHARCEKDILAYCVRIAQLEAKLERLSPGETS